MQDRPINNFHGVKNKIAERLRDLRHERGLSMTEVAQKTGLSFSHISKLETGGGNPGKGSLAMLATFYGVAMESLWGEQSPPIAAMAIQPAAKQNVHIDMIEVICHMVAKEDTIDKAKVVMQALKCSYGDALAIVVRQGLKGG